MICVNHREGRNWLDKTTYINECKADDNLEKSFIDKMPNWTFVIVDPFDPTYNPAKQIDQFSNEDEYIAGFKKLMIDCI